MKWKSYKIWLPLFILCSLSWAVYKPLSPPIMSIEKQKATEERNKSLFSYGKEKPVAPTPQKTDYADVGLKIGSGIGATMSLINFIEKLLKWFRRKKK